MICKLGFSGAVLDLVVALSVAAGRKKIAVGKAFRVETEPIP